MSSSGAGACELDPQIMMVMYLAKSCDSYECDIGVWRKLITWRKREHFV